MPTLIQNLYTHTHPRDCGGYVRRLRGVEDAEPMEEEEVEPSRVVEGSNPSGVVIRSESEEGESLRVADEVAPQEIEAEDIGEWSEDDEEVLWKRPVWIDEFGNENEEPTESEDEEEPQSEDEEPVPRTRDEGREVFVFARDRILRNELERNCEVSPMQVREAAESSNVPPQFHVWFWV